MVSDDLLSSLTICRFSDESGYCLDRLALEESNRITKPHTAADLGRDVLDERDVFEIQLVV